MREVSNYIGYENILEFTIRDFQYDIWSSFNNIMLISYYFEGTIWKKQKNRTKSPELHSDAQ